MQNLRGQFSIRDWGLWGQIDFPRKCKQNRQLWMEWENQEGTGKEKGDEQENTGETN